MGRRQKAALITTAEMSPEEERRVRTARYVWMMSIRAFLVVLCGVFLMVRMPWIWLWLPLVLVGMAALPWLAVTMANDRLPRRRGGFTPHRHAARALPSERRSQSEHRTLEAE